MTMNVQDSPQSNAVGRLGRLLIAGFAAAMLAAMPADAARAQAAPDGGPLGGSLANPPDSFADLVDTLLPAVVNISSAQTVSGAPGPEIPQFPPGSPFEDFFEDFFNRRGAPQRRATSLGSGFIISPEGHVVTNNHVIEGADQITVVLQDDTTLDAELIGVDPRTDIAVLRIQTDRPLPFVAFGDSEQMRVGDWVLAIGNPFGLGGSVTAGIISARARNINAGPYDDFIQTDASINRGNSGGPMFNMDGQVIGINTAIFTPTGGSVGVGFAIPSSLAESVVGQIVEFGRTRRGWLGVRIQTVTEDIAESLGLDVPRGALISSITAGGPAADTDLQPGDVIVEFNGVEIEDMHRLPRVVADTPVGSAVDVVVWRQGQLQSVQVVLGELEAAEQAGLLDDLGQMPTAPATEELDALGLALAELTDPLRNRFGLSSATEGVVITAVADVGAAADEGLVPGDLILEVNQRQVTTPADVAARIDDALQADRNSVLLMVDSNGDVRFVALNISALRNDG